MYPESKACSLVPMKIWHFEKDGICEEAKKAINSNEYFCQLKIDGHFYQYEKTAHNEYLFSRNLSKNTGFLSEKSANVPHIMEALRNLPANTILLGEIYLPGKTAQYVTKIMGSLPERARKIQYGEGMEGKRGRRGVPVHYYIHDIIEYNGVNLMQVPALTRYKILRAVFLKHKLQFQQYLTLAEVYTENMIDVVEKFLKKGEEGAVFKRKDGLYYPDKRPARLTFKIKQNATDDVICIGFCTPTKIYEGKNLDSWTLWERIADWDIDYNPIYELIEGPMYVHYLHRPDLYTPVTKGYFYNWKTAIKIGAIKDGEIVSLGTVSSGLTDKQKNDMVKNPKKYLGKTVEISYMLKDPVEKTFRHARVVRFRDDKPGRECLLDEIFP